MDAFDTPLLCLHCRCAPQSVRLQEQGLPLCSACGSRRGIRAVYIRPRGWTPAWDAHLQRLAERARLGLPVAVDEPGYVIPRPPARRRPARLCRRFRLAVDFLEGP